jgi:hypothetical protein
MFTFPPGPEDDASIAGRETSPVRYEDVSQDGRLRVEGIWWPTGRLLWNQGALGARLFRLGRAHGIRSVLTRVVLEATEHHLAPRVPVEHSLRYRFEAAEGVRGGDRRIFFNTWLTTTAPQADSAGGFGVGAGTPGIIARAYGQRVFARLERPPGERGVTELPGPDFDPVPSHQGEWVEAETLLAIPDGAEPLEPAPRLDPARVVFGLSHTDSNQHVNFLSYPRFFEQAALGRLVDLGLGAMVMARRVELGYRRPCFAGDTHRVVLQAFREGDAIGVAVAMVDPTDGAEVRPRFEDFGTLRCAARMWLRP